MNHRVGAPVLAAVVGAAPLPSVPADPARVDVRLSGWKVELSQPGVSAGTVRFVITNAGSIPHGFEVEGQGIEQEIPMIQPGASDTLTVTRQPGTYEVYCRVRQARHQKLCVN